MTFKMSWTTWTLNMNVLLQMLSFRKWILKFSILPQKAEFKYPTICECNLKAWKSKKQLKKWNVQTLDILDWEKKFLTFFVDKGQVWFLKWVDPYIGILNSESSKYLLALVIWKLEKVKRRKNEKSFLKCSDFQDEKIELCLAPKTGYYFEIELVWK